MRHVIKHILLHFNHLPLFIAVFFIVRNINALLDQIFNRYQMKGRYELHRYPMSQVQDNITGIVTFRAS